MVIAQGKSRWEFPLPKKHLTEKNIIFDKQYKHWIQKKMVVLCLLHRNLGTKKIGTEVFGKFHNVVVEENVEDKMARKSN